MKTLSEILTLIENDLNGIPRKYDELYKAGEDKSHFPEALLDLPVKNRIEYFHNKVITHKHLETITTEIMNYCSFPYRPMGLVIGPTNIGKTTVLEKINYLLTLEYLEKMNENPGFIPIGFGEVINSSKRPYPWNDIYKYGYEMLNEELTKRRILPTYKGENSPRKAFIDALIHRQTKIFQFDEAHNFIKVAEIFGQHDELKTLTNLTQTSFLLYGTYELVRFINPNSQLGLRTTEFHFKRYSPLKIDEEDFTEFCKVLVNFENYLPVSKTPNLFDKAEFFYQYSAGCVGNLKRWLLTALSVALNSGDKNLSDSWFERTAAPQPKLLSLVEDIEVGENYFKRAEEKDSTVDEIIKKKLGISIQGFHGKTTKEVPSKKRRHYFTRNPRRDPITPITDEQRE